MSYVDSGIARRVALAVTEAGSVSWTHYVVLCGGRRIADLLLRENIFVRGVANGVGFENTMLEATVREDMERQSGVEDVVVKYVLR